MCSVKVIGAKGFILAGLVSGLAPMVASAAITPTGLPIAIQPNTLTNIYYESAAKNASGAFAVTWLEFRPSGPEILHAASYDALGNPVAPAFAVEAAAGNLLVPPSIAINTSGQFVVSWTTSSGDPGTTDLVVYAQAFNTDGTPLSTAVNVADLGTRPLDHADNAFYGAAVSMADNGSYLVSWDHDLMSYTLTGAGCSSNSKCTENQTFQYSTYAQTYSADGTPQAAPITVYQSPQLTSSFNVNFGAPASAFHHRKLPSTTIDPSGSFSIAYDGVSGSYSTIDLARFNADGSLWSLTAVGKLNSKYSASGAVLASNATGQAVVAWGQYKSPTQGYQVTSFHLQRIKADGSKNGFASVLKAGTIANGEASNNFSAYLPTLAMEASGNYALGWISSRIDTGALVNSAWVQAYLANGVTDGSPVALASTPGDLNLGIDSTLRPVLLQETYVQGVSNTLGLQAQQYTGP